jgi:WD40 repeat protein
MILLDGHDGIVTALAYAPDGRSLATGSTDGRVKLWDAFAGREIREYVWLRQGMWLSSLAFSGDGKLLAAGFRGEVIVWSALSGQMLHWHRLSSEDTYHADPALVSFHPTEERLAIACARSAVVEVDPLSDRRLRTLTSPLPDTTWRQVFPWRCLVRAGHTLAAGLIDHVALWGKEGVFQRTDGSPLPYLHWPNGAFVALATDSDGRWLAGARGRGVALWDLTQLGPEVRRERTFKVGDQVNAVALTPDGRTLLAGGDDWTVHVWDVSSGQKRTDYNWRLGQVVALAMAPDGMTAAVSGRKGRQVLIWDLE